MILDSNTDHGGLVGNFAAALMRSAQQMTLLEVKASVGDLGPQ